MDSRIREIEQRVGRAREGLAEGGREDYLKQLYLLDAEIRAVIRENGTLPEHLRELLQDAAPRRRKSPLRTAGMALALMLFVTAATFAIAWFNQGNAPELAFAAGAETTPENTTGQPAVRNNPALERISRLASAQLSRRGQADPGAQAGAGNPVAAAIEQPPAAAATPDNPARPVAPTRELAAASSPETTVRRSNGEPDAIPVVFIPPLAETPEHGGVRVAASSQERPDGAAHQPASPLDQPNLFATQEKAGFDWTIARFALPVADANRDQEITVIKVAAPAAEQPEATALRDTGESTVVDKRLSTTDNKVDK